MLKDEATFVDPWVRYHAAMFGMANLYVFDNGSTDEVVLKTLAAFEQEGLNLDRSHTSQADFRDKGCVIGSLVRRLDAETDYEFYIMLDCDEFVTLRVGSHYTCDIAAIHGYLDGLEGEKHMLKVDTNLQNIPGRSGEFQAAPYSKVIFPHGVLAWTDHGFHEGKTRTGLGYRTCDIVYAHFHYRPYEELVRFARQKLSAEMPAEDLDNLDKLRQFTGRGHHMVGYLSQGKDAYYEQFKNIKSPIVFPELLIRFRQLGTSAPFSSFMMPLSERVARSSADEGERGKSISSTTRPHLVVDEATTIRIRGWALDAMNPKAPMILRFLVDDTLVWEGICNGVRPDVQASGHPTDLVGFDFNLRPGMTPGSRLTIQRSDRSELRMMIMGHAEKEARLAVAPPLPSEIYGHIDSFRHGCIRGWVLRSAMTPAGKKLLGGCTVALMQEDAIVRQVEANMDRPDVADALQGEQQCGFAIDVPPRAARMNPTFHILVLPEAHELIGSPCVAVPVDVP